MDAQFLEFHFGVQPIGKYGHKSLAGVLGRDRHEQHHAGHCSRDERDRDRLRRRSLSVPRVLIATGRDEVQEIRQPSIARSAEELECLRAPYYGTRFEHGRGLMGFARARRVCLWAAMAALSILGIACKDEATAGAIRVRSIKFVGVHTWTNQRSGTRWRRGPVRSCPGARRGIFIGRSSMTT